MLALRNGAGASVTNTGCAEKDGGGGRAFGGNSESKEEAIAIALAQNPAPWDGGLEPGYMLTSTGEKILAEDWDDVEGAM